MDVKILLWKVFLVKKGKGKNATNCLIFRFFFTSNVSILVKFHSTDMMLILNPRFCIAFSNHFPTHCSGLSGGGRRGARGARGCSDVAWACENYIPRAPRVSITGKFNFGIYNNGYESHAKTRTIVCEKYSLVRILRVKYVCAFV